jgi:predicted transcriptional regulator
MSISMGEIKKTSFRLDSDLLDQLDHLSIDKRTTVTALIHEAIVDILGKYGKKKK